MVFGQNRTSWIFNTFSVLFIIFVPRLIVLLPQISTQVLASSKPSVSWGGARKTARKSKKKKARREETKNACGQTLTTKGPSAHF